MPEIKANKFHGYSIVRPEPQTGFTDEAERYLHARPGGEYIPDENAHSFAVPNLGSTKYIALCKIAEEQPSPEQEAWRGYFLFAVLEEPKLLILVPESRVKKRESN